MYNSDCERYGKLLKDYQTDFADKTNNFPKDLVNMQERMSIACNEENFLKKKSNDKNNKDKGKDTGLNDNVTYASSFVQVAQGKKVCWVCGGDHLANVFVHIEIKSPVISGIRIPWSHIIHSSNVHMYIM